MNERSQKAFDFAAETVKQLITLSTGIIALTITFSTELLDDLSGGTRAILMSGWLAYLLSIICGVWALMALTGNLERVGQTDKSEESEQKVSIRSGNVTLPAGLQVAAFLAGTLLVVVFGIVSVGC